MSGLFSGTPLEQPVTCERCTKPLGVCTCPRDRHNGKILDPKDQALRIRREQRRGKFVTVITGFAARSDRTDDLPALFKNLKSKLAAGGSLSSNSKANYSPGSSSSSSSSSSSGKLDITIEFQGDHRDTLVEHFKKLGYPAKPAGG